LKKKDESDTSVEEGIESKNNESEWMRMANLRIKLKYPMHDDYGIFDLFPFMCACIKGKNKVKRIDNVNREIGTETNID
jgi:hypothetical protein